MRRLIVGLAVLAAWLLVVGLAGESDQESAMEARYMSALAHCAAAQEGGCR